MNFLLSLAFKNLTRHTKRTVLTVIAIAFGVGLLIWMDGMLRWADNESQRNLIRYEFGNFLVSTKAFAEDRDNLPLDSLMDRQTVQKILRIAEESGIPASARTGFSGVLSFQRGFGLPYAITVIDPESHAAVSKLKEDMIEGSFLSSGSMGILISRSAARDLGAGPGDRIVLETRTPYKSFQAIEVGIEGIYDADNPVLNKYQAFVSEAFGREHLQTGGAAAEIVFRTAGEKNEPGLSRVREALSQAGLADLSVSTWQELGADFIAFSTTKKAGTRIMVFFIFVITAIGIVNTMLMAVFERIRELGMMRALGMRDSAVVKSFILESAALGFLGSLAGVVFGALLNFQGVYWGLDFTKMIGDADMGYRVSAVFYNEWNPDTMIAALLFGTLCSMLVSIGPARKAVQLGITDSIRYM